MKQVYKYDEQGFFVEPVLISDEEETPINCTEKSLPIPNYKPMFNGDEWVETLTEEEIEAIKNQLQPTSELEQLKQENAQMKQQIEYILSKIGG